ncbi:unnamed protein product, partial [marine sediment metagenome]
MGDFKLFLKYIFDLRGYLEFFGSGLKKFLKLKNISYLLMIFAIYFLIKLPKPTNYTPALVMLAVAFVLQLYLTYKAGEHRYWYRKK